MSEAPLCILNVHAHPDDEASKGAPTIARYHDEGVHTVLVTCTGGEAGDILNPAMDRPEVRENLPSIRLQELDRAAKIIGYDEVVLLGYRDSGMPDTPDNANPDCFARADLDEAVGRLVAVIRRERPQVIITYGDDQENYYPHPDHIRVHEITLPAFDRAGDPEWYPEAGEPWQPQKLYYTVWARRRMEAMHERFKELGLESPFSDEWFQRDWGDDRITTEIDVTGYGEVRKEALLAHETQIDPKSPFWFGLPSEEMAKLSSQEDYVRAKSRVDAPLPEDDLFAGVR
ncbi:MAG TPA: mycothiol conjugate amidase Mca [Acidimicrobiales bacterium]|jgi:mycothiol S-conjugate amidase